MPLLHRDPDEVVFEVVAPSAQPQSWHWHLSEQDGVLIVTPAGALADPLPAELAEQLGALIAERPVIVDLTGMTLASAAPVVGLVGWVLGTGHHPDRCCAVCGRATAQALLGKGHVGRCLAVFGSVGDALQARRYAHEGYGSGWHPDVRS
jgi:hypothetical protein